MTYSAEFAFDMVCLGYFDRAFGAGILHCKRNISLVAFHALAGTEFCVVNLPVEGDRAKIAIFVT